MKLRMPSPAMLVAILALVVAMSGSAVAASLITSSQIKNGTIQVKDLSKSAVRALHGAKGSSGTAGAPGAPGATGPIGPSNVFEFTHEANVELPNNATPFTASVGPGQYLIIGKAEVNNNSSVTARPDCILTAGTDVDDALLGTSPESTNDDTAAGTLTLTHTFAAAGSVTLGCTDGGVAGKGGGTVEKVRITAIKIGSVTTQTI